MISGLPKFALSATLIFFTISCVPVAPQVTDIKAVPADRAIVMGRLAGENDGRWLGESSISIYLHEYKTLQDIPSVYMGLSDHIRVDVKNDSGVFLVTLPPGKYYISGFHYGGTHIEYNNNKSRPETNRFAIFEAKAGVVNYIGSFKVGDYRQTSTFDLVSSSTIILNE